MKNRSLTWIAAAILAMGMATACGDDAPAGNNATNNGTNNGGTNNGGTNNGGTNNGGTNNGTNNGGTNNGTNNGGTNNGGIMLPPPPPGCDDANPPERCMEPATTQTWAPASILDTLVIAGSTDGPECCFDYTDDGNPDNALGELLAGVMMGGESVKDSVNTSIEEGIASGSLVIVLEHDTITALDMMQDFTVNFWIGEWPMGSTMMIDPAGGNEVLINPDSIDGDPMTSSLPQAYVPDAVLSANGDIEAGPGVVELQIEALGAPLNFRVSEARIRATADPAASMLDGTGVALNGGELGGYILKEDVFSAINAFASTCTCLNLSGDLVSVDPETGTASCDPDRDAANCETQGESSCKQLSDSCGLLTAIPAISDIDLDGEEGGEAISIGANFTTKGATITGVADGT